MDSGQAKKQGLLEEKLRVSPSEAESSLGKGCREEVLAQIWLLGQGRGPSQERRAVQVVMTMTSSRRGLWGRGQ